MKVLAINASPTVDGKTSRLLGRIKRKFSTLRILNLRSTKAPEAAERIKQADVVVFATPVHWFNVSTLMKNLLDEMKDVEGGNVWPYEGKIAFLIAIGEEDGGQQAVNQMFAALSHMGMCFPPYAAQFRNTNMRRRSERKWQDEIEQSISQQLNKFVEHFGDGRKPFPAVE